MPKKGYKQTEEHKRKMSESKRGKRISSYGIFHSETKKCIICNNIFYPHYGDSIEQWRNRKFCSRECRYKSQIGKSSNIKGKHLSEEIKLKISKANKGKHPSEKTKLKMSEAGKGKFGENHSAWKGGKKLAKARYKASRRGLGHIYLNNCEQDGWVGHHLDYNYVMFIPEELHKSIWHSQKNIELMNKINDKVYEWFVKYYLRT